MGDDSRGRLAVSGLAVNEPREDRADVGSGNRLFSTDENTAGAVGPTAVGSLHRRISHRRRAVA